MWHFFCKSENRIDIGVVSCASQSHLTCKLFIVHFAIAACMLIEQSTQVNLTWLTAESFKRLFELIKIQSTFQSKVEMLKEPFDCFTLIVSCMCALSNFFENEGFEFG